MGKAPGQKKLQVVFIRKFDGKMLTEGGRILTQIKGNIQHPPLEYLYQFGLGVGSQLIMQASYGVFHRPGNIVLRSEEHTSELQSRPHLVCRLLLEKKNS